MSKTIYINLSEIDELQENIMYFVDWWVHEKKTPIPLKEIMTKMISEGAQKDSTIYSLKILMRKGYLRRTINGGGNSRAAFVQLRRI